MGTQQNSTESGFAGRILVVDDEPSIRQTLKELLELRGYEVKTAEDGRSALLELESGNFDLLLTDLYMPNIDGLELIKSVQQTELSVVMLTEHPSLRKAIDVMKLGAVDFLPKPFDPETLIHVVRRTFKERALRLENKRLTAEVNNKAVIEQLNRELHGKIAELTKLNLISERLAPVVDTNQLFEQIVLLAGELTDSQRVSLMLLDRRRQSLRIRAARGVPAEIIRSAEVKIGEGVAGVVAQRKSPMRVNRGMNPRSGRDARGNHYTYDSWINVPLLISNEIFGVLNVSEHLDGAVYAPEDERILINLAEKAAAKIENNALYESLYENLLDTLHSLVTTIEAKDLYTHRHSRRVTEIAVVLGRHLKISNEDIESLKFATALHDIGKIGIRDSILTKDGQLDQEEYSTIKTHPLIGSKIVEPLGLTKAEHSIIRSHHERIDGKGYPDALRNGEIDQLARIVSVADAYDAMTSTRSYRKALSLSDAFDELRNGMNTQFDADVVNALFESVKENPLLVPAPEEHLPDSSSALLSEF